MKETGKRVCEAPKGKFLRVGVVAAIFAVVLISGFFSAPFAAAQEEKSEQKTVQEDKARGEYELETMTVTAQKQEENVQEVPVSITVFNELDIEDKKIESVIDMADFVPNLMIYNHIPGVNAPTVRGITAPGPSLDTSTGLFVDGVPILMAPGFEEDMLDVERIEVLRGPQGTLYGKGTESGAISIITRQPDNEFRGKVSAQGGKLLSGGTGDKLTGAFALNLSGPILQDKLFWGIAGQYSQKDGFIENTMTGDTMNDKEHWFGRAHLRWTPMDELDISLIVSHLEHDDGASNFNLTAMGAAAYGLPSTPEYRKVSSNMDVKNDPKSDSRSMKITYDFNNALALTLVSTNRLYKHYGSQDYDFTPATVMHTSQESEYSRISQEIRLDYSKDRLKWLAGLYYDLNLPHGTFS